MDTVALFAGMIGLSPREGAARFAAAGVPIFPCKPAEKRPLTEHGFRDATSDDRQIARWWSRWPEANIGMPTGRASAVEVVDIDVHGRVRGFAAFELARREGLVDRWQALVKTASGGMHAYYPADPDRVQASWQAARAGIDFRYNKQRNAELLGLADDYLETAEGYYERALRPAIDNLLSAAELTVQAQMLGQSEQTTFHNVRDKWLRDNECLGNAPDGFFALLKRLRSERAAARYGDGVVSISDDELPELINRVRTMIEHAAGRAGVVAVDPSVGNR